MSSVPLFLSVCILMETPNTNMTGFMCYPIMGRMVVPRQILCDAANEYWSTWRGGANLSGEALLSAAENVSTPSAALLHSALRGWLGVDSTAQQLNRC